MIGLFGWPQVTTAAAFITAVAVVLNPITPDLPDITVPALFPLDAGRGVPFQAAPPAPVGGPIPAVPAGTPATAAPIRYPVVVPPSGSAPSAAPWRGTVPEYLPVPSVPTIAALPDNAVEIVPIATGFEPDLRVQIPVVKVADPLAGIPLTGDRPRTRTARQPFVALPSGNRPLPAAAVDPGTATPGQPETPDVPSVRGRVPASPAGPSVRGHRGPIERD